MVEVGSLQPTASEKQSGQKEMEFCPQPEEDWMRLLPQLSLQRSK